MSSQAFDMVTIMRCLQVLMEEIKLQRWIPSTSEQEKVVNWYYRHQTSLLKMTGLKSLASPSYAVLNQYLVDNDFKPLFEPFKGVGVVSIMDILVEWLQKGGLVDIDTYMGTYPGFQLQTDVVVGFGTRRGTLLRLNTKSADPLWILVPYDHKLKLSGLDLFDLASEVMSSNHNPRPLLQGACIPMIDIEIQPDLSFLLGTKSLDVKSDLWFISQAFQQFKFRMNQVGARIEVSTSMSMDRSADPYPYVYVVDQPFYLWTTKPGVPLPIGVLYLDFDSWKVPPKL